MRRFSSAYLRDTRRGLWDDREPLVDLLGGPTERILDVGAGTGEFTSVLRQETAGTVVPLDADPTLLRAGGLTDGLQGAATRLPFRTDGFDLVACQALLVNVPEPLAVLEEFSRVASDRVGSVEPDNTNVTVDSSVAAESAVARRARTAYMAGLETDSGIGAALRELFETAGLRDLSVTKTVHERRIEPPYSEQAVESARRKVTARRLDEHRDTMLDGGLTIDGFETLRDDWQAMGRAVVDQMHSESYSRRETIPFYVASGRVGGW